MHLDDINKVLNLQGVSVVNVMEPVGKTVIISVIPVDYIQPCPCCQCKQVIRKGYKGHRHVRHLPVFEYVTQLKIPNIRMQCKKCHANFSWEYSFVQGKTRFTDDFKRKMATDTIGSTVSHTAKNNTVSYSSCERMFKEYLEVIVPQLDQKTKQVSLATNKLILGIDDFAIRKGHNYNTGIHDIRNGSLLHVIAGRRSDDLRNDVKQHPELYKLNPVAIVMDLAKIYHTFAKEIFPNALRIADRFHVNRYILDALQNIRRRVAKGSLMSCTLLKSNKSLISRRADTLSKKDKQLLDKLLSSSLDLRAVYELKEELITWYECSSNISQAKYVYKKWLLKAKSLNIPELNQALITFENWEEEITNYHQYRFTNASVEGRNNKIKALQRRCYFTRNKRYYLFRIKAECNLHILEV